jgi:hypothetical protein
MKRKPKLTKPLKNEFLITEACKANPKSINEALRKTGLQRNTFFESLERTKNKGFVSYEVQGKGKKAINIQVTELGVSFLCKMVFSHPSLRQGTSTMVWYFNQQTKTTSAIDKRVINLDFALNGAIEKWKCPFHPNSERSYKFLKNKGAIASCKEPGCKQNQHWDNQPPSFRNYELPI